MARGVLILKLGEICGSRFHAGRISVAAGKCPKIGSNPMCSANIFLLWKLQKSIVRF